MTNRILIQHGSQWLALTLEDYQKAVDLGATLRPGTMPDRAEQRRKTGLVAHTGRSDAVQCF